MKNTVNGGESQIYELGDESQNVYTFCVSHDFSAQWYFASWIYIALGF